MSRPVTPICDVCGAAKREANHWWTACLSAGRLCLWEFEPLQSAPTIPMWDLCSEQCVNRLVGQWMRGQLQ